MLRFVGHLVSGVLGTLAAETANLEGVLLQAKGSLDEVDSAWEGPDADAFLAEVDSQMIPGVAALLAALLGLRLRIQRAAEIIVQADRAAAAMVQQARQGFERIR
jgi:uncharacterized protein YukE